MPVTYNMFCGTLQAPKEKSHVLQMASPWGVVYRIVCPYKFSLSLLPLSFLPLGVVIATPCHCILEVCNFLTSQELNSGKIAFSLSGDTVFLNTVETLRTSGFGLNSFCIMRWP